MKKSVSITTLAAVLAAAVVLTFFASFALAAVLFYEVPAAVTEEKDVFDIVKKIYGDRYVGKVLVSGEGTETDGSMTLSEQINAYIAAVGDLYGRYFTQEEYAEYLEENSGDYCGIGVTVQQNTDVRYKVDGKEYTGGLKVISITKGAPAESVLNIGDYIVGAKGMLYADVGYDEVISYIKGEPGTKAEITVLSGVQRKLCSECQRYHDDTENAKINNIEVERKELEKITVFASMVSDDTAYVKITGFENKTPEQFTEALIGVIESGAKDFIFDLRDNPGGQLTSVFKVLATILDFDKNSDKTALVRVFDKNGVNTEAYTALSVEYMDYYDIEDGDKKPSFSSYKNVSAEYTEKAKNMRKLAKSEKDTEKADEYTALAEKYEKFSKFEYNIPGDAKVAVITNENTASAGELFTAVLRDYKISTTVGMTTFGKGSMQSFINLSGTNDTSLGVLKITAHAYTSAYSESYNGIGIEPDLKVELRGEAAEESLMQLDKSEDAQFICAFNIINPDGKMEMPDDSCYKIIE